MNKIISVLVTGANSQLGKTLQEYMHLSTFDFHFTDIEILDITKKESVNKVFEQKNYDFCFNFAAYTNVNLAEKEQEKCYAVNVQAVENLAKACQKYHTTLVHISTDFVFDGAQTIPYKETDVANPLNYYGKSKLLSEQVIRKYLDRYYIIRTSWLYSHYNNNFVKTISRLAQTKNELKIVADQVGTPTYAVDLIDFVLKLTTKENANFGLYHYSNSGSASWFDFGKEIVDNLAIEKDVFAIDSNQFKTPATRPKYSVLSKEKAVNNFDIQPRTWQKALAEYFVKFKNN